VIVGLWLRNRFETKNGELNPKALTYAKIYLALIIVVQWNFISYLIPSIDFWAYSAFFAIIAVFFLDHRYMLIVEGELIFSIALSWLLNGKELLPYGDAHFISNLILRVVCILLVGGYLWLLTFLVQKYLFGTLERMASYDALTETRNRRTLYTEMKRLEKEGTYSVLMCDLDNFKRINDTYGHECGDVILQKVAAVVKNSVFADDIVFRYGGEEFLVLLKCGMEQALSTAETIRSCVEASVVDWHGKKLGVTVTVGVAESTAKLTEDDLISLADGRMYEGKEKGKNTVVGG